MTLFTRTLLFLLLLASNASANLNELFGNTSSTTAFLPVEQAFQFEGQVIDDEAVLNVTVAPEHYLYKHQFSFNKGSGLEAVGNAQYPQAERMYDPFFEKELDAFKRSFQIRLPVQYRGNVPELSIQYQGCAEAGLCYPPSTVTLPLAVSGEPSATVNIEDGKSAEKSQPNSSDDFSLMSLMLFFVAGIGLALTPCVLPMFPILSSLILGQQSLSKPHAALLTSSYVLSMAATFAVAGTLMGLFGAGLNLHAKLQSPWLLYPMALLFVLLALSMFGLYEVQLPAIIREKLSVGQQRSGSVVGAMVMGCLSALVVSPCVSAPLAGALVYISTTGNALLGGLNLLLLGLGMGLPLFALAMGGRQWLPKSGNWMLGVRNVFGVLLLGVAIWMLERVIEPAFTLLLWGALSMGCAVFLGALRATTDGVMAKLKQTLGLLLLVYGAALLFGAAAGQSNPLQPLMGVVGAPSSSTVAGSQFYTVTSINELEQQLAQAQRRGQRAMVDLYADWCIACKVMERTVFPSPLVASTLSDMTLIKFDITANTQEQQDFLNQHQLFGPPALLFYAKDGQLVHTLAGEATAEQLANQLASW